MLDSIIKLLIGDLEEKRTYRQMMKRVEALPKDYRYAFKKIQHYMYVVGPPNGDMSIFTDLRMFTDLVELFETCTAEGKELLDVIGNDVGSFSEEFMRAYAVDSQIFRAKLNKEVMEHLKKEDETR